jgi:hypothetical protein
MEANTHGETRASTQSTKSKHTAKRKQLHSETEANIGRNESKHRAKRKKTHGETKGNTRRTEDTNAAPATARANQSEETFPRRSTPTASRTKGCPHAHYPCTGAPASAAKSTLGCSLSRMFSL